MLSSGLAQPVQRTLVCFPSNARKVDWRNPTLHFCSPSNFAFFWWTENNHSFSWSQVLDITRVSKHMMLQELVFKLPMP